MTDEYSDNLADTLKKLRFSLSLTLQELASKSGISASHLGRIERCERFPSARTLRKIAKPLGIEENELFLLAGFLSDQSHTENHSPTRRLDPVVANMLAQEPVEVQHAVVGVINLLKSIVKYK